MSSGGSAPKVKETENEKALASVANQDWQRYQQVFAPEEEKLIGQYERFGTPAYREEQEGLYANTAMQAAPSTMAPAGLNPGSGRYITGVDNANTATGAGLGRSVNTADLNTRGQYLQGLGSLIQLGRNLKNTSTAGLSSAASRDQAVETAKENADLASEAGLYGGLGTIAGAGLYYGLNKLSNPSTPAAQKAPAAPSFANGQGYYYGR